MKFNIQKTIYARSIFFVSQKSILKFDNFFAFANIQIQRKFQTSYDITE